MIKKITILISIALTLILFTNLLVKHIIAPTYTATLDNTKIKFHNNIPSLPASDIAIDGIRDLSSQEAAFCFKTIPIDAYVGFDPKTKEFLLLEGHTDDFKIIISRSDISSCLVIKGLEHKSTINNTSIITGYTKGGWKGIIGNTIIFYSSFTMGNYSIYLENAGPISESNILCNSHAKKLKELLDTVNFEFTQIKYQ